jgi:hypothetical protein
MFDPGFLSDTMFHGSQSAGMQDVGRDPIFRKYDDH